MSWGSGAWGLTPWGGGDASELALLSACALRENVVRLEFNAPVLFTGLLDANDATGRARYAISAVAGTVGLDGRAARTVRVVSAAPEKSDANLVDVTVDRPLSPYPARYVASVNNLLTVAGYPIDTSAQNLPFDGVQMLRVPPTLEKAMPMRDFANPQTLRDLEGIPEYADGVLGTFRTDDTGDYAFDEGRANLHKRILRRLITRPGGFAHMPSYGLGLLQRLKRLDLAVERQKFSSEAELQIAQEPDVAQVKVRMRTIRPGLVSITVLVRTRAGAGAKFDYPFAVGAN